MAFLAGGWGSTSAVRGAGNHRRGIAAGWAGDVQRRDRAAEDALGRAELRNAGVLVLIRRGLGIGGDELRVPANLLPNLLVVRVEAVDEHAVEVGHLGAQGVARLVELLVGHLQVVVAGLEGVDDHLQLGSLGRLQLVVLDGGLQVGPGDHGRLPAGGGLALAGGVGRGGVVAVHCVCGVLCVVLFCVVLG